MDGRVRQDNSDMSKVLTAIGTLGAKVDGLTNTVEGQGDKIDTVGGALALVKEEMSAFKAHCEAHRRETDGLHTTLYGGNGKSGLVRDVEVHSGALEILVEDKEKKSDRLWQLTIGVAIAAILAITAAGLSIWKAF